MYKVNQDTYARVLRMLMENPITAHEAAEETGMHLITAQSLMRALKKHKVVHVSGWEADSLGRDTTPIYKMGRGRDRPRHKFTASERQARCRAKKKAMVLTAALMGVR
jgi:predicted ArsR family transcriptional regulator